MPGEQVWSLTGDFHCGSTVGLTANPKSRIQEELLKRFQSAISWQGPVDVVFLNGDGTDGRDEKGRDIDEECLMDQGEDVANLICMMNPKTEVILGTGTRYHDAVDGQEVIKHIKSEVQYKVLKATGRDIKVSITRKLKTTVNGWFLLEGRHFVGGSGIPHGRATAPLRVQTWNILNAALESSRRNETAQWPDLMVFSHRHYYLAAENAWGDVVVLPGWQALGGKYGDEICDGHVDLGLVRLRVGGKETDGWAREKMLFSAGVVRRTERR